MTNIKALIGAGGTGGHLFPAVAVAEEFKQQTNNNFSAFFVGNSEKLEARIIPQLGYNFTAIPIRGFSGMLSASTLSLPFKIIKSVSMVRNIIKAEKPDFVLCTGAYISYPAGIAASHSKIPLVLMESNVSPGKTIKLLSSKADLIVTSFESTKNYFTEEVQSKVCYFGNPLRKMFDSPPTKQDARISFGLSPDIPTVLIFGGSLGARAINNATLNAINEFKNKNIQFIWQIGKEFKLVSEIPNNVKVLEFIDDMAAAYSAADLVISRSGATTVAELTYNGKASILVPLPSASNNEQAANAIELMKSNAAIIIDNEEIGTKIAESINNILFNEQKLIEMKAAAFKLAKKDAAKDTVNKIREMINK